MSIYLGRIIKLSKRNFVVIPREGELVSSVHEANKEKHTANWSVRVSEKNLQ